MTQDIRENFHKNLGVLREFRDTTGAYGVGKKTAGKVAGKIGSKFIPGVGQALTAYDLATGAAEGYKKGGVRGAIKGAAKKVVGLDDEPEEKPTKSPAKYKPKLKKPKSKARELAQRALKKMRRAGRKVGRGIKTLGKGAVAAGLAAGAAALAGRAGSENGEKEKLPTPTALSTPEFRMQAKAEAPTGSSSIASERQRMRQVYGESSNFDVVRKLASEKKAVDTIVIGENTITINSRIAKKIMGIYESLNADNRQKVKNILNEDVTEVRKLINFSIKA